MLNAIIRFSIGNKGIIALLVLALVGWGLMALNRLPMDAVPDITNNQVQVITYSPSLSPQEVEQLITFPIEMGMANIPQLKESRSISRFGLSVVTLVFEEHTDVYWARQQVAERIRAVSAEIPPGLGTPGLGPVSTGLSEIFQYTILPKPGYEHKFNAMEIRSIQDWLVRRQLLGTEGVADISSFGGYLKQYEVAIQPDKLRSFGLSIAEVMDAIGRSNQNAGGSYLAKGPEAWFIRSEGMVKSLAEIESIYLKNTESGLPIRVKDVGQVRFGHAVRYGAMTRNATGEAVGGIVLMLKGANSAQVIEKVKERMATIEKMLPEGLEVNVFLDRSALIDRTISTVSKNLIEGALIVILVLVLFLGNFRAGFLVASVIPLSMLFALGMMDLFGVSGNLMSLGAIDFGLIVDGAVIVVEATMHHLLLAYPGKKLTASEMDEEVFQSASKIRNSAAFGEIIILIVYLPILALVGIEGKMFRPMAQTVSFAILGAFFLSLTYVPMASAWFLSRQPAPGFSWMERSMETLIRVYQSALSLVLRFGKTFLLASVIMLVGSLYVFFQMGGVFIPSLDEGDFAVETRLKPGSSIDKTILATQDASRILQQKFPQVKEVIGKIGTAEIPTDPMGFEACDMMVLLKNREDWPDPRLPKEALADEMKDALSRIPGVAFGFQQPIQMRFNELMTGSKQDVAIKIFGEDLEELARQGKKLGRLIENVQGVQDMYIESLNGLPQMEVHVDREKLALYHLHVDDVNRTIQSAFAGAPCGTVYEGEKRFALTVRLDSSHRNSLEDIRRLYIQNAENQSVPLGQVADVSFRLGPNQIQREEGKRRLTVAFNIRGRDVESVVREMESLLDVRFRLPSGYSFAIGGEFKNLQEAKERLQIAVPVALLLILFLLYFTFGSMVQGLVIFSAIPLSAIGGIWALWLREMPFSISAGVGFIALFGVAVLNGIVLMSEFNHLKANGETDMLSIILRATSTRFRPVLMTASVASLGFLPMAFSGSAGAEVQKPLATVVIGGLISATFLTLFILPVLFQMMGKIGSPKITALLLFLTLVPMTMPAQQKSETVDQVVNRARQASLSLQSLRWQTEAGKEAVKEAVDIGKTTVNLQVGQTNSAYRDNHINVQQTIPFPTVWKRQKDLARAQVSLAENREKLAEKELIRAVKLDFYALEKVVALQGLYRSMDSLQARVVTVIKRRLELGDATSLDLILARNLALEWQGKAAILSGQWFDYQRKVQFWTQSTDIIIPQSLPLEMVPIQAPSTDKHPMVLMGQYYQTVVQKQRKWEQSKLLPDLFLGYFNQSLTGLGSDDVYYPHSRRFQGMQAGIQVPLWTKPQMARIKAAGFMEKSAEAEYQLAKARLTRDADVARAHWKAAIVAHQMISETELPNARKARQQATKAFESGQISWMELSQALKTVFQTEERSIEARYQAQITQTHFEYHVEQ